MIKPNRSSQESILKSGYRNQLKKHSENSQSNRTSQANKSVVEDGVKSKTTKREHDIRSRSSQRSRNTSVQRAFNSAFGNPLIINESHINDTQSQIQVERNPFIQNPQYFHKKVIERHPSEPIGLMNNSEVVSEVHTQIQRLNRLRQEHEIIKQVNSDDELRFDNQELGSSTGGRTQNQNFSRAKYIYESRESVPLQIIKNKKLNKSVTQKALERESSKNPQKQEDNISHYSQEQTNEHLNLHPRPKQDKTVIETNTYLLQISTLQSALTQSSLKIEQLLTESIKSKQKLKMYQQTIEKNHSLQNQIKMMKETEKYFKREIEMKDDEIHRFQKRIKIMKETVEMFEKESEIKEKEILVLQTLAMNSRRWIGVNDHDQKSLATIVQEFFKKETSNKQHQREIRQKQTQASIINTKQTKQQEGLQSYYAQINNDLKERLQRSQHQIYQLQSQNQTLKRQLENEKFKNIQLQQTFASRLKELSQSQSEAQLKGQESTINKEIQAIHEQLEKIQKSADLSSINYVHELEEKLRQLQEVIRTENEQKRRFTEQLVNFKQQQKFLTQSNNQLQHQNFTLTKENTHLTKEITHIKKQLSQIQQQYWNFKINSVPKEQYLASQNERYKLSLKIDEHQSYGLSNSTTLQDHQLIRNLNSIKEEYLKLEEAYLQKARECESVKSQLKKIVGQMNHVQSEVEFLQKEIQAERAHNAQIYEKMQQQEVRMVEMLNLTDTNHTYTQKISQLQQTILDLQLSLKEKDFVINQMELQQKKSLNQEKLLYNEIKLQLSQSNIENLSLKNSLHQQSKQHSQQVQNYMREIQIREDQLLQQQKHLTQVNRLDKEMMEKQIRLLERQLFQILKEKEKLMEESIRMAHLEHQLKAIIVKEKNNRKITESVDHLWMIKEAEYWNINSIIKLTQENPEVQ